MKVFIISNFVKYFTTFPRIKKYILLNNFLIFILVHDFEMLYNAWFNGNIYIIVNNEHFNTYKNFFSFFLYNDNEEYSAMHFHTHIYINISHYALLMRKLTLY